MNRVSGFDWWSNCHLFRRTNKWNGKSNLLLNRSVVTFVFLGCRSTSSALEHGDQSQKLWKVSCAHISQHGRMRSFVHTFGNQKLIQVQGTLLMNHFFVSLIQAIMVNGEFKCLGSTQHLKNKFSKGFFLTIKIGFENTSESLDQRIVNVKNFVSMNFSGAVLK